MSKHSLQKYDCDRSGFTRRKEELIRQRGLLLSPDEVDDLSRIKTPNPRWASPRENSTTTTVVNSRTVSDISASGVTALLQTSAFKEDGAHQDFYMLVQGDGGAIDITANPQIVDGADNNRLTLEGTSDTNTLLLEDGNGLALAGGASFTLKDDYAITLVYDATDDIWRETSRTTDTGGL